MPNLVGTGLNQVPTNGMLGGLAYQDPEHASIKDLDLKNLSQINSEITDTAVDVFVYDTRKDSDGGAWRKRTQYTSWYNETLGTATRGTRREFPSVAVIVVETAKVTIYDGDDPDLPMWMVFNQGVPKIFYTTATSASMLNGKLVFGTNPNAATYWDGGIKVIDFISEFIRSYSNSSSIYNYNLNVSQRNDNYTGAQFSNANGILTNPNVNDLAMTVLLNAPIDDDTGLPVPTIAVGTDSGVSVIKDDGSVFDLTYQETSNRIVSMIDIDSNGRIYWSTRETGTAPGIYFHEADLPAADSSAEPPVNIACHQAGAANAVKPTLIDGSIRDVVRTKDRTVLSLSGNDNKGHLNLYNVTGNVNSSGSVDNFEMVDISTDYNTGYIIGDIKGVFLSDTNTTNATYTTVADDWATAGAWTKQPNISISSTGSGTSGTLSITGSNSGSNVYFFNPIIVEENTDYVVSITFGAYNANAFLINNTQYSTSGSVLDIHGLSGLTRGGHFNSGSNTTLYIQGWQFSNTATTITNLVVQKVSEKDRSVKNKGLQVFGTITKSAVATGADLVAYSGFNGSNYLEQPYNTDLNFGTGDFSLMNWIYVTAGGDYQVVFDRWSPSGGNARFYWGLETNEKIYFHHREDASSNATDLTGSTVLTAGVWHHMAAVRKGSSVEVYLDGKLDNSTTSAIRNVTPGSTQPILRIGNNAVTSPSDPMLSKLALLRISGSAPSAEQIKKIYEDEKVLFQENAKATLYGSPSNVTAIAYDDSTNLLYAGTAEGRSEFQGLRRINNTTTAVTTVMSVSNGLVAEQ